MKCTILKDFPYSHDGNSSETLKAGDVDRDIRDDLVPGLEAAGIVKRAEKQKILPGMEPPRKPMAPENKIIPAAPDNKVSPVVAHEDKEAMDTVPHRDRRKHK